MGHDVFISHSSKDKAAADAVCAALEANGVRCWIAPRDIKPGENWATSILRGIAGCRMMVLVFSSHTNDSQHIRREVERAVHRGIPIAPLRIADAMPKDDLEYFLSSSHWMDALTGPLQKHLREFTQKVRALLEAGGDAAKAAPELSAAAEPVAPAMPAIASAPAPAVPRRRSRVPAIVVTLLLTGAAVAGWAFRGEMGRRFRTVANNQPLTRELPATALPSDAKSFTNSVGMTFIRIEPGEFMMGSPVSEDDRQTNETQHRVKLTKAFMMASTPVTQSQWVSVRGDNPSHVQGDNLPVVSVSWEDVMAFCKKLSEKDGKKYRLPTEAEREYACRAGTTTPYYTGRGEAALKEAGWYYFNSEKKSHPVGQKKPNPWGLYDMHGNVLEWCSDYYGPYPAGNAVDPGGPPGGDEEASRVLRGGAWGSTTLGCRAAYRRWFAPGSRHGDVGFRVCLDRSQIPTTAAVIPSPPAPVTGSNAKTFTNTLDMKFVRIEPGTFMMGSPAGEPGRGATETRHQVTLTRPFMMAATHVTRRQFAAFVAENGYKTGDGKPPWENVSFDQTDAQPVVNVGWNDAVAFCKWLSANEHKSYRLPTEAEWEYACRARTQTAYFWGNDPDAGQGYANCSDLTRKEQPENLKRPNDEFFNWHDGFVYTSPVGSFKPNNFGLYDMIGNAEQWCSDYYCINPSADAVDPTGPPVGDKNAPRVLRGGSWLSATPHNCRCAFRIGTAPDNRNPDRGFRVVLDY